MSTPPLDFGELHELKRWNTPTVYNGWEQITKANAGRDGFNLEPVHDYMPEMGPMVGYAVTVVAQPSDPTARQRVPNGWSEYRRYVASVPGPKIVVVQDLDKPGLYGAFWGEITSNFHRAVGCVGTIADAGIRDLDEMKAAGLKALARGMCVGHAYSWPLRWGVEVEVFGRKIAPGQLIHADKHGFLAVPRGEEKALLDAARFMDSNECRSFLRILREVENRSPKEICDAMDQAGDAFSHATRAKFGRKGEW